MCPHADIRSLEQDPKTVTKLPTVRLRLHRAEEIVEPYTVAGEEAQQLGMQEGGLPLRIRRTVYDLEGRPIEYVIITYRADSYTFRIELSRDQET